MVLLRSMQKKKGEPIGKKEVNQHCIVRSYFRIAIEITIGLHLIAISSNLKILYRMRVVKKFYLFPCNVLAVNGSVLNVATNIQTFIYTRGKLHIATLVPIYLYNTKPPPRKFDLKQKSKKSTNGLRMSENIEHLISSLQIFNGFNNVQYNYLSSVF